MLEINNSNSHVEVWGGIECTINRVNNNYFDQLEYSGHYDRLSDLDLVASLGIKTLRYPVLWEKHERTKGAKINWNFASERLNRLKDHGITPIAGLVHHGSGPEFVNFYDGSFEEGLAKYAKKVAEQFPWLEYFTPVNEPLTTARFCGLYGFWYPHGKTDFDFFKVLLSECKATVMAMQAIRDVIPNAKLIQTEDLGRCHSTPLLQYQADLENERRWLSYELLCGRLTPDKVMWQYMLKAGIQEDELTYFLENNCPPHICGFNYYLTSERYLDEDLKKYPEHFYGGNGTHTYADVHTVLVDLEEETGANVLLKEAWERLGLPLAITECHLHSPREDQMRWFNEMWKTLNQLKTEGVDIRAITAWAIFGLTGWNSLCTKPGGLYEPGVFSLRSGTPRPTALASYIQELCTNNKSEHPVLEGLGWWKRDDRITYNKKHIAQLSSKNPVKTCRPVLIIGKNGTLGKAFGRTCEDRHIHYKSLSRTELDITRRVEVERVIRELNPWAIINTAGYVKVDEAEDERTSCYNANFKGAVILAETCATLGIKLLTFSSDMVFDGKKAAPYSESDAVSPLNIYGKSKAKAEARILAINPEALIIRTSSFFGPWDDYNFAATTLRDLKDQKKVQAAKDVFISPTYVPDLVDESLNILLDNTNGILHVANSGSISWYEFARKLAVLAGYDDSYIEALPILRMQKKAKRPTNSILKSEKGVELPTLENALGRYFEAIENNNYSATRKAG
ncbi:family 1 glycosylhydrolase [Desertivirga brevis]|uniref:family 1 glycosylhydrolase n=1 Tax=Desertivirga brevis TaxID=2810310 RepID=UPI001A968E4F|nr:family 1 glycosylhydrolase [Pedobacter sp. SYSU D00873]